MADSIQKPKLRFKEFDDEWNSREFKEIIVLTRGLTYHPNDLRQTGIRVLRSSNISEDYFRISDEEDVFVTPTAVNIPTALDGDILITAANGSQKLIGKHAIIEGLINDVAVAGGFMLLGKSNDSNFANSLMHASWYQKFLTIYSAGGNGSIANLNKAELEKYSVAIPNDSLETVKIGDFFSKIDSSLKLLRKKKINLQHLKQTMLEKMFPKDGADVPEIRFEGCKGLWKQCILDDIAEVISGGTPDTTNPAFWDGDVNWYSPSEIGDYPYVTESVRKITKLGLCNSSAKLLPADKTILFTSRASIGDMAILKSEGCTNQGFQSLILKKNIDVYFVYSMGFLLKRYSVKFASGSTFLEISNDKLRSMPIRIPDFEEQKKISGYFMKIDSIIYTYQNQLNKFQSLKKALLERMFV